MRRVNLIERIVLIVMRDLVIPGVGVLLALSHPPAWMVPVVVAAWGTPVIERGTRKGKDK